MSTISPNRVASLVGDFDRSPAYAGLATQLRLLISDGRIPPGARLPSERSLTVALGVSRTTVTRAYDTLREAGFLASRSGSGSVAALPGEQRQAQDLLLTPRIADGTHIDLTCAAPPAVCGINAATERAVARLPQFLQGTGYYPTGLPELCERVAQRYRDRGLPTAPDQIVIMPGALSAVAVVARAVLRTGDRVVAERPSYPNAIAALRQAGARLVPLDLDQADGWDLEGLNRTLSRDRPRVAYLIPDFHNPTGALIPTTQRQAMATMLHRHHAVAVIDESLVEFNLSGEDMPVPYPVVDSTAICVGSLSKLVWGGLRVGWIRLPDRDPDQQIRTAVVSSRLSFDLGAALLEQLVSSELMTDFEALVTDRRTTLRASRDALVDAVRERLPQWRFTVPDGGLALWCQLPADQASRLLGTASRHGVHLAPGAAFSPGGGYGDRLRLPFALRPDQLIEAVDRICAAAADTRAPLPTLDPPRIIA